MQIYLQTCYFLHIFEQKREKKTEWMQDRTGASRDHLPRTNREQTENKPTTTP